MSTVRIPTAMRTAFFNIKVTAASLQRNRDLAKSIMGALQTNIGTRAEGKGWNASLSFKTAEKLKAEGILV